jgi:hypothetical protein
MFFDNEVKIGLSLVDLNVALRVLALMEEFSLMNFPLRDATDVNCWLSTIAAPVLDRLGIRVGGQDSGLVLRDLVIVMGEAHLDMMCVCCMDPAVAEMESLTMTVGGSLIKLANFFFA